MDKVSFFNQALGLLGEAEYVAGTPGFDACNLWWPDVMREMLRSGAWSFATKERTLDYNEREAGYVLPQGCLRLLWVGADRYVILGRVVRPEVDAREGLKVRYVCDELAQVEHLPSVSPRFIHAVRLLLAARIAPRVTGDVRLSQQLEAQAWAAQEEALHEDVRQFGSNDQHPLSDIINASITL